MTIDLTNLYLQQSELDETIARNHDVSYESTRDRRILALLVELGEFANATRCFKYWSNKKSEDQHIVLDEYVDGLHFFLSLGLDINVSKKIYHRTKYEDSLTKQILKTYRLLCAFLVNQDEASYIRAFQAFLNIVPLLKVRWSTIEKAYLKKLDVNYNRQNNNY
ncbi:MAG: dUTPase [Erysipelotrichaceae bacterium]|jgi:dimeric dUTPase (all-alpha-NTP-PPase superfamily)|nr:dUTPase [Erysipelotrichaceae bacterium]